MRIKGIHLKADLIMLGARLIAPLTNRSIYGTQNAVPLIRIKYRVESRKMQLATLYSLLATLFYQNRLFM